MVKNGPVIDGSGKDTVWGQACYISDFKDTFGERNPIPAAIATNIGILSDRENLYFLLQAKEPFPQAITAKATQKDKKDIFSDDTFEIFLAPPNNSMKYYQFCVNTKGIIQEVEQPGSNTSREVLKNV